MASETETLRADSLEAQQSEADAREALQQSAEYGKLLLSRNEALEQELEALRQEQARKSATEVLQRSRLEEECRRLEAELETKCKPQERQGYSRTSQLSSTVDSDEEPSLAQMQQRLKRCEKSEQEHREAACLAEEHAHMLEERNQKLGEECRRLQAECLKLQRPDSDTQRKPRLEDTPETVASEAEIHKLKSDSVPTSPSSPWSPFRRSRVGRFSLEDFDIQALTEERDAARAEKATSEARCDARLREMEEEITALRLLLEEETGRTNTMAEHIDYLGGLLEERQAANGAAVMLKSLGLSRPGSPERGEMLSAALAFKGRQSTVDEATRRKPRESSIASGREEIPSLQSFLADLRSRSPSMSRKRSRAPHRTLEDFLGEKPTSLANVTASTRAVASLSPAEVDSGSKVSFLELLGWSRCSHCGSLMWFSNDPKTNGLNGKNPNPKNRKKPLAKSWTLALSNQEVESPAQPVRGRTLGGRG